MQPGHLEELQCNRANGPGIFELWHRLEEPHGVVESESDVGSEAALQVIPLEVPTGDQKARERELAEWLGLGHGSGCRCPIQVFEHRLRSREGGEVAALLAGVLEGEEHRLGRRTGDIVQRLKEGDGLWGIIFVVIAVEGGVGVSEEVDRAQRTSFHRLLREAPMGQPGCWNGPLFVEVGGDQVDHLVQRAREGNLGRGHRRLSRIGGLEYARIDNDLVSIRRSLRAEPDLEVLIAGHGAGEAGHGWSDPLIAGNHSLDRSLLRREHFVENRFIAATHDRPSLRRIAHPGCRRARNPGSCQRPARGKLMPDIPDDELEWRFSTSGGPGGQHANRTASRAELRFDITSSRAFDSASKDRILSRLGDQAPGGVVTIVADDTRSQWRNRQIARARLDDLLDAALRPPPPPRRKTRPSRAARERRLSDKRAQSRRKRQRRRPDNDDG